MSGGSHSLNLGLLDQEASMQNIDRLVEALEMEAKESRMSKRRKLFSDEPSNSALQVYQPLDRDEPSSSAVQVYQPLERSIVPSFPNFGITLKELSMLSRDEVFPYVNTHRLKTDGILKISGELFQPTRSSISITSEYIMDLSTIGLRKLVDFLVKGECRRIVPPSKVEAKFLKLTSRKYKKDVWQDIAPWLLGHDRNDKFSGGKFREGWQAIVRIVRVDFLARQAIARHEPMLLEARNAFTNTRVEWDSEKENLFVKEKLLKKSLTRPRRWLQRLNSAWKLFD
ncbi:hypothetical protein R1flu_010901 [Riccia fluitans]|uniref:Uncharacterized protein n=1 Tax=Riccia fluitans TaxID=41844 RepID=A0ABD1Z7D2_9MARC